MKSGRERGSAGLRVAKVLNESMEVDNEQVRVTKNS